MLSSSHHLSTCLMTLKATALLIPCFIATCVRKSLRGLCLVIVYHHVLNFVILHVKPINTKGWNCLHNPSSSPNILRGQCFAVAANTAWAPRAKTRMGKIMIIDLLSGDVWNCYPQMLSPSPHPFQLLVLVVKSRCPSPTPCSPPMSRIVYVLCPSM